MSCFDETVNDINYKRSEMRVFWMIVFSAYKLT